MNYFDKLRLEGKKLDEGIHKMTEIWNAPHIHIGRSYTRYTENTEDLQEAAKANAAAEALSKSVAELKESLIVDLEKSEQELSEMRKFIEESWSTYEDMEQKISDIEVLFTENGYVTENNENEIINNREEKEDLTTNSTNSDKPEVECTPYLSWKSRMKTFDASTPTINGFSIKKENKEEPTVKSVKDLEISMAQKLRMSNNIIQTPHRQSPREPILSRHYYELVKKKECRDEKL